MPEALHAPPALDAAPAKHGGLGAHSPAPAPGRGHQQGQTHMHLLSLPLHAKHQLLVPAPRACLNHHRAPSSTIPLGAPCSLCTCTRTCTCTCAFTSTCTCARTTISPAVATISPTLAAGALASLVSLDIVDVPDSRHWDPTGETWVTDGVAWRGRGWGACNTGFHTGTNTQLPTHTLANRPGTTLNTHTVTPAPLKSAPRTRGVPMQMSTPWEAPAPPGLHPPGQPLAGRLRGGPSPPLAPPHCGQAPEQSS